VDVIRIAIQRPVTVTVGAILVVMFGLIALGAIPIQLTPTIDRPIIRVSTAWPGRSPQEIVDEITREQEKQLKNVTNLKDMQSISQEGTATITLEFYIGTDIDRALQEVSDALRQVPEYPEDVEEPVIDATEGAEESAITWMILDLKPGTEAKHPGFDIAQLYDAVDRQIKPYLERIDGVAEVNIYGGREREVQVLVNEVALAQRGLNHLHLIDALRAENENVSAGTIAEGKRDYRVRVTGQFQSESDVLDTVIAYRDGKPVFVRDVAEVRFDYQKLRGFVRSFGKPSLALNCLQQTGSNVMRIMEDVRERVEEINSDFLPRLHPEVGPDLRLRIVYDETDYIRAAIDLVVNNVWFGGLLSALALLLFLRSLRATLIISLAIPISIIGTFMVMALLGRSFNVVSLAGLAFATGVVVDNGTVVLENIYRRLQAGDSAFEAAHRGGREVWTAILASTLTCVGVFIPILTIQDEAGQLFRDISLAVVVSVLISLPISITLVPTAAAHWIRSRADIESKNPTVHRIQDLFGLVPWLSKQTGRFGSGVLWLMSGWRAWSVRPLLIIAMTVLSLWGSFKLMPPLDYLPLGNQNLAFGILFIPPGYSNEHKIKVAERVEEVVKPYAEVDMNDPSAMAALPPIPVLGFGGPTGAPPFDPVPVKNFFVVGFAGGMFAGAQSEDPQRVIPVAQLISNAMQGIPDAFGFAAQTSIFGSGAGGGNTVDIEVSGPDLDRVLAASSMMEGMLRGQGYFNVQPNPQNYNLKQPEWQIEVNRRGRELGLRTQAVGTAVRALFDGAFVDDFLLDGDMVDMVLLPSGGRLDYKEQLATIPIATPAGPVVPMESVVDVSSRLAPQDILRVEELPSVTLRVVPPQHETVEQVMTKVREAVIAPVERAGMIDQSMRINLKGTARKLDEVRAALFGSRDPDARVSGVQKGVIGVAVVLAVLGMVVGVRASVRAIRTREGKYVYAAIGAMLIGLALAGLIGGLAWQPQLITARFIWALAVTYLLMCALFESFLYPLVIMFSVPLAIVGGFAALRIVHDWTSSIPTMQPQNLDVLTMLGFIILVGTVVSNAILLVEQALNFMHPERFGARERPLPAIEAIAESVRTRIRPIFMTTLTTITGLIPLVVSPGAGSEMYRGLGAVVLGGLLVSTVFTLVLVPLAFSVTLQMGEGLRALFAGRSSPNRLRPLDPAIAAADGAIRSLPAKKPDEATR